jgi:hypothetical protein
VQKNQATVVTERAKIAAPEIEIRGTVRGALGDPAAELRLPSIFQWPEKAEAGGLAADDSIKEKASLCTPMMIMVMGPVTKVAGVAHSTTTTARS